jgi:hypothetical protein
MTIEQLNERFTKLANLHGRKIDALREEVLNTRKAILNLAETLERVADAVPDLKPEDRAKIKQATGRG